MKSILNQKPARLFVILGLFFVTNALIAEFIGVKVFSLFKTFGLEPIKVALFGVADLSLDLSAGVLLWPVVFIMTDIVNEYFGRRGVKFLSYLTVGLIIYGFFMVFFAIQLVPSDFWTTAHLTGLSGEAHSTALAKVSDYNYAFQIVFGQGLWIIIGSVIAFLVGQLVDVAVFHKIKAATGENKVWARATGSTLVSQFLDSFVVLFIAFYIGADWPLVRVLAIGCVQYSYKFTVAVIVTPLIYLAHNQIDSYLGQEVADKMKAEAQK